jgi:hypothetical protein
MAESLIPKLNQEFNDQVDLGTRLNQQINTLFKNPVDNWPDDQLRGLEGDRYVDVLNGVMQRIDNSQRFIAGRDFQALDRIDAIREKSGPEGAERGINPAFKTQVPDEKLLDTLKSYARGDMKREDAELAITNRYNSWRGEIADKVKELSQPAPAKPEVNEPQQNQPDPPGLTSV